jgi:hypothetical protein
MALITVTRPAAPNLAFAPRDYSSQYNEQLNNIFRLYFNQLDTTLQAIASNLNILQTEIVTLQVEVADLQVQGNNSQTLIWLDM